MPLDALGKALLVMGLLLAGIGLLLLVGSRLPLLGRLPGDLAYESDNVRIYFPLATMLVISLVLSALLTLLANLFGRR